MPAASATSSETSEYEDSSDSKSKGKGRLTKSGGGNSSKKQRDDKGKGKKKVKSSSGAGLSAKTEVLHSISPEYYYTYANGDGNGRSPSYDRLKSQVAAGAQGLSEAEKRVRKGVDLYKRLRISLAAAAQASGAPRETIRRRAQGQSSHEEQHKTAGQRLNDSEEAALLHFIVKMEASCFPMRRIDIEGAAMSVIMARESDPVPLGHCWFSRFINRHAKLLAFRTKATLDRQRTRVLTEENARRFFSL
ncbi:hypothetical protein OC834_005686 [Tilletia horrida]|nr:hypothetical protein OC834_005686 [Tilletia horrida]